MLFFRQYKKHKNAVIAILFYRLLKTIIEIAGGCIGGKVNYLAPLLSLLVC